MLKAKVDDETAPDSKRCLEANACSGKWMALSYVAVRFKPALASASRGWFFSA